MSAFFAGIAGFVASLVTIAIMSKLIVGKVMFSLADVVIVAIATGAGVGAVAALGMLILDGS